jgi:hypothetical protein
MSLIVEGLEWSRVYWIKGTEKRGSSQNAVSDPPCSGWMGAIIIPGEKRSTLFCPFTFDAYIVPNDCGEIKSGDSQAHITIAWLKKFLPKKWAELQGYGFQKDYNTAALVFKRLGIPVPAQILVGGEEDTRTKGGKDTNAKLLKPVKMSSKRGKFLAWYLSNPEASASVREAMAEFGMTRSNVLSYLYMIQKDHGIGYGLVGDTATIQMPEGCTNPFDVEWENTQEENDDWLD